MRAIDVFGYGAIAAEPISNRQKAAEIAAQAFAQKAHPGMPAQPAKITPPALPPAGFSDWRVFNQWMDGHRPSPQPATTVSSTQIRELFGG